MIAKEQVSITATMLHEIGHASGLGHSSKKSDLMYFARERNYISSNDRDALGAIYEHHTPHPTQ